MDQQLHLNSPVLSGNSKLVTAYSSGKPQKAFLFDLKEPVLFDDAWLWQKERQKRLIEDPHVPQAVWLLQHSACYTLGRGADERNLLFDPLKPPFDLFRIDRGGEVTHHLPGQLVVYLALNLHHYKKDLDWYLRQLEQVLIDVLHSLGLAGRRSNGLTGVWLENYKVGFIGIGCRRWITQHGLSLNVDCDLSGFKGIVPCGLVGHPSGKLSSWIPGITIEDVKPLFKQSIEERFQLSWLPPET